MIGTATPKPLKGTIKRLKAALSSAAAATRR